MWRDVLMHAHWTPQLAALGTAALRRTFSLAPSSPAADIPPFIALHARHGDFSQYCHGAPASECFAPLSAFDRRVRELQDELEASSLFEDAKARQGVLKAAIPETLLNKLGYETLTKRLPESYQRALFASYVASKFIYSCGVKASNVDFYRFATGLASKA